MAKQKMSKKPARWKASPLKGSFMVLSIVGFLVTTYLVYPRSSNFGVTFMIVFAAMFVASLVSMTKAPVSEKPEVR